MKYTQTHLKGCIDHYKCTRLEDHQMNKHGLRQWWCELCNVSDLEVKAEESITVGENLFNFKRWFNGMKKFSSVKVSPQPLGGDELDKP